MNTKKSLSINYHKNQSKLMNTDLNRFIDAQEKIYHEALNEIKSGRKSSHWMWFIFPQIEGLGFSSTSKFYGIKNLDEAKEYLKHELLGTRLKEISSELLKLKETDAKKIFGSPDHLKLKSCMTLFSLVDEDTNSIFKEVLKKFFRGDVDTKTIQLIKK